MAESLRLFVFGSLVGLLPGIAQAAVLRVGLHWPGWHVGHSLAWAAGATVGLGLAAEIGYVLAPRLGELLGLGLLGVVLGGVAGGLQALVLRPFIGHPARWLAATLVASVCGGGLSGVLFQTLATGELGDLILLPFALCVGALALGLVQGLALARLLGDPIPAPRRGGQATSQA
jgi:hypothetical protein